ncbi:hypothetical protein SCOR_01555 [Sulfidibacter corallicola]|uniref:Uncharacterized protein n=1 Tax=Sulfidibacter corallicola TaxID=2818388 RepID=A0A8A4TFS1_SULCO|nr:hypothetical protein [Sulfidibacter corallicola]QTD48786.1 hypothetical protein J3U87_24660 [Sulfidibacter corallicola]
MTSDKEKCFQEALEKYNEVAEQSGSRDPIDANFQEGWVQDIDGTWSPTGNETWWSMVNSVRKTWDIIAGNRPPRPPGSDYPIQIRRPDVTIRSGSRTVVVDTKFTRANGTVDDWGTRPGAGNGNLQQEDYNDINSQMNPDGDAPEDVKLDPETCRCDGKGDPVEVPVMVPNPMMDPTGQLFFMPFPAPGALGVPSFAPPMIPVFP